MKFNIALVHVLFFFFLFFCLCVYSMLKTIITGLFTTLLFNFVKAAGEEDVFGLQPEIHHVFRPDEKMPPVLFSKLFSIVVLFPWLILTFGVHVLNITLNND